MNQVMGVSDWNFLCPAGMEPRPDEDISKRPSLEEFDGELAIFQVMPNETTQQPLHTVYTVTSHTWYMQGITERLSRTEDDCDVGWLTVNQRPVKDTLNTLVSKWKAVYAGYLERQVKGE